MRSHDFNIEVSDRLRQLSITLKKKKTQTSAEDDLDVEKNQTSLERAKINLTA